MNGSKKLCREAKGWKKYHNDNNKSTPLLALLMGQTYDYKSTGPSCLPTEMLWSGTGNGPCVLRKRGMGENKQAGWIVCDASTSVEEGAATKGCGAARRGAAWRGVAWRGEAPVLPASSLLLSLSRVSSFIQCGVIRSGPDPHQEIQLPPWNGLFSSLPSLKLSSQSSAKKTFKVFVAELFYRKLSYILEYVPSNRWRKIKCATGVSNRILGGKFYGGKYTHTNSGLQWDRDSLVNICE